MRDKAYVRAGVRQAVQRRTCMYEAQAKTTQIAAYETCAMTAVLAVLAAALAH